MPYVEEMRQPHQPHGGEPEFFDQLSPKFIEYQFGGSKLMVQQQIFKVRRRRASIAHA